MKSERDYRKLTLTIVLYFGQQVGRNLQTMATTELQDLETDTILVKHGAEENWHKQVDESCKFDDN